MCITARVSINSPFIYVCSIKIFCETVTKLPTSDCLAFILQRKLLDSHCFTCKRYEGACSLELFPRSPDHFVSWANKKNSGYSLLGPAFKSAQRRICLNFLPWAMLNQIKCILLNERPRDISLVPITWPNLPCLPEHEWRVILYTFERRKNPLRFSKTWLKRIFTKYVLLD